jgi:hypothetical protein
MSSESVIQLLERIRQAHNPNTHISIGRDEKMFFYNTKSHIINYICNKTREIYGNECNADADTDVSFYEYNQMIYSYIYFGFNPKFLTQEQQNVNHLQYTYFMWVNTTEHNLWFNNNVNYVTANVRRRFYSRNHREFPGQEIIDPKNQKKIDQANEYNELLKNNNFTELFTKIKGKHLHGIKFTNAAKLKIYTFIYNESKTKIPSIRPLSDVIPDIHRSLNTKFITPFMYYGYVPDFLSKEQQEDLGLSQFYFLWQKEGDPNALKRPIGLEISNQNFHEYKYWSNAQLNAYYFANILPDILKRCDINININNPIYKKELEMNDPNFKILIDEVIREGEQILTDSEIKNYVKDEIQNNGGGSSIDRRTYDYLWHMTQKIISSLVEVKHIKDKIKNSLDTKLKNIVNKHDQSKNRFKWTNLCQPNKLSELEMDELEELAIQEKIPYYLMMTKRELCVEFAKRFENVINGKKKVEPKCINTTSILGTDIADIPPEFFFSYSSNNKIYCDDIRDLYKHFKMNGNKNPIDRTPIKQSVVNNINEWYNYLTNITVNMLDFDETEIILPIRSQLSSKFTTLASKLNYPNSGELFINANTVKLMLFIVELHKEGILSDSELRMLSGFTDINQRKLILIDTLLIKINNDPLRIEIPGQRDPLSAIAINTSNIYNEIFKS